jgi:hypothetical protein
MEDESRMGESPGANRCGASALGIETSVFRHAAVHRMEHGPVPRASGFDSRRRLRPHALARGAAPVSGEFCRALVEPVHESL